MNLYHFPGYPVYLDAAAAEIGRPEAAGPARRISALAAIANLCAQAAVASPHDVDGILAKASEIHAQLQAAGRAAELMLTDVRNGRGISAAASMETLQNPASPQRRPKASRSLA